MRGASLWLPPRFVASLTALSAAAPGAGGIDLRLMIQRPAPGAAELGSNVHLTMRVPNYGTRGA